MRTDQDTIEGIPITLLRAAAGGSCAARGLVLCFHGFTSSTADWLHELERFAREGFAVVGVDCVGHGRRSGPGFERRFADPATRDEALIEVVSATADEVPTLIDALLDRGLAAPGRIGAFGVSMGGFIVYAAVAKEPRLVAAVSLLGSPVWWMRPSAHGPHRDLEAFDRIHLLSLTAGRDEAVPAAHAADFHRRLARRFDDHAERLRHVDYPDSGHFMEPGDWDRAIGESRAWLRRHLGGEGGTR